MTTRIVPVLAGLALLAGSAGCSGLQFVDDNGLLITSPKNKAVVELPVQVRWERKTGVPTPATYAVYVDRIPPRSGTKDAKARGERDGVYLTSATALTLRDLAPRLGARTQDRNKHEITVVMLDAQGRRLGERADYITIEVRT